MRTVRTTTILLPVEVNVRSIFTCMSWAPQLSEFIYTVFSPQKKNSENTCVTIFLKQTMHTAQNLGTQFSERKNTVLRARVRSPHRLGQFSPNTFKQSLQVKTELLTTQTRSSQNLDTKLSESEHKVLRAQTQTSEGARVQHSFILSLTLGESQPMMLMCLSRSFGFLSQRLECWNRVFPTPLHARSFRYR